MVNLLAYYHDHESKYCVDEFKGLVDEEMTKTIFVRTRMKMRNMTRRISVKEGRG